MEKTKQKVIIFSSIATVLLFSMGYIQEANSAAVVDQGTMTIVIGCVLDIPAQNMAFGNVNNLATVDGSITVRNLGNQAAEASIDAPIPTGGTTAQKGDWVDDPTTPVSVIDAADTEIFEGAVSKGDLTTVPLAITDIEPDNLGASGANDNVLTVTVFVNPIQSFAGALTLDITLVNDGCVANI